MFWSNRGSSAAENALKFFFMVLPLCMILSPLFPLSLSLAKDISSFRHLKLYLHKQILHEGEVSWHQYSHSLNQILVSPLSLPLFPSTDLSLTKEYVPFSSMT